MSPKLRETKDEKRQDLMAYEQGALAYSKALPAQGMELCTELLNVKFILGE